MRRGYEVTLFAFPEMPVVSISDAQRHPLPWLDWQGTVYHGLPRNLFTYRERPGTYLAFLGRISPEKRVDRAIEIARRAGMPIKVAAKIDPADRPYFEREIEGLLQDPLVEFVGELRELEKDELLGNAYATLFPIDWPEPFGLVMIESLACGTPVIAYAHGSVSEVLEDGVTGFVVDSVEAAAEAVEKVADLRRARCRQYFESRFTAAKMVEGYLNIYRKVLAEGANSGGEVPVARGEVPEPRTTT